MVQYPEEEEPGLGHPGVVRRGSLCLHSLLRGEQAGLRGPGAGVLGDLSLQDVTKQSKV